MGGSLVVGSRTVAAVALPAAQAPRFDEADELFFSTPAPGDVMTLGGLAFESDASRRISLRFTGNEHLSGHVGLVSVGLNGEFVGELEIVPGKMSEARYIALRGELERLWSGLVFDPQGLGRLSAGLPPPEELLRRMDHAVRSILESPHEILVGAAVVRTAHTARRAQELTPALVRRAQSGLPAVTRTVVRSTSNSANAAVATTLRSLGRYAIRRGDTSTASRCRAYLAHPMLQSLPSIRLDESWVMRSDPRYRQVHAIARLLDRPELGATEGPGELRLGVAALSRLYEYWVYLKVLEAAHAKYGSPLGAGFAGLAVRTARGARLELPAGTTVTFPGNVHVAFEPPITQAGSGWMALEYAGPVPTRDSRPQARISPDVVVYREGDGGSAVIYDAKYVGRALVEQDAAEIHRKYARIRFRGVPIVRAVVAVHPHVGLATMWAGYGHIGLAPLAPAVELPLPSAARGTASSSPASEAAVSESGSSDGVAVIIDQFSTREILQGRRVQIDKVALALAGDGPLVSTSIVMPDILELRGFAHAVRSVGVRVVHQSDSSVESRREAIVALVEKVPRGRRIVLVTVDAALMAEVRRIRSDVEFVTDL